MADDRKARAHQESNLAPIGEPCEGPGEPSEEHQPLPSDVLVEALTRKRRIAALDGSSVPGWLMAEPVEVALAWLESHGKHCRHPMQCADTPGPLRPLLKMRRAASNERRHQVHSALWRYPSSRLVEAVRAEVAEAHIDLVGDIEIGALFEADALRSALDGLENARAQTLAAVLWATGLTDPRASELFRVLPSLVPAVGEMGERTAANEAAIGVTEPREKGRHREKRLALEHEVAELKKGLAAARDDRRTRAKQLARAERGSEAANEELEKLRRRIEESEQALADALDRTREAEAMLREAERLRRESSAASTAYRIDLERAQAELSDTQKERAAMVRRLSETQRRIQELEAQLRAIPREKEAIADWLEREENRLRDREYTVEGGARARVKEEMRLRRKLEIAFLDAYPEFRQERPAGIGSTRSLTFRALGGGNEVGRSAYLLSIGAHDVLLDCGIAVGARREEDQVPDLSGLARLDGLLVTHAHTDHVGWIPALVASRDYFPIYCTKPTAEFLPVMLHDSRGHYERFLAEERLKKKYDPTATDVVEAYTRDDIVETETRLLEARVGEPQGVGATDLTATFFPAGHILGAASVLLEGGGRQVVVSGDISGTAQRTVGAFNVPQELTDIDVLVLEATYGDRARPPANLAEDQLVEFVADSVRRGIALLPCFALGRAQEVLAILNSARRSNRLPADLKILVDGMINKINPVYIEYGKLDASDFVEVRGQVDRDLALHAAVGPDATPTAVVTTSGMLTGGPVVEWARRLLPDGRHRMALLGYQDEGAPGGLVRKLARERPPYTITLRDEEGETFEVRVAAPVENIGLSAHADQDELVDYAAAVRPKQIILVHGDQDARAALRERLIRERVCAHVELGHHLRVP